MRADTEQRLTDLAVQHPKMSPNKILRHVRHREGHSFTDGPAYRLVVEAQCAKLRDEEAQAETRQRAEMHTEFRNKLAAMKAHRAQETTPSSESYTPEDVLAMIHEIQSRLTKLRPLLAQRAEPQYDEFHQWCEDNRPLIDAFRCDDVLVELARREL